MNKIGKLFEINGLQVLTFIIQQLSFYTVDHDILLDVLPMHFDIEGVVLSWLESYLPSRQLKVNLGSEYSPLKDVMGSVPQGSCMRPVLYLIYASTLANVIENL